MYVGFVSSVSESVPDVDGQHCPCPVRVSFLSGFSWKNPVRHLSVSILFRGRTPSGYLEKRLSGVYRTMTRKSCPVRRPLVCALVRPYSGYLIIFSKKILDIHLGVNTVVGLEDLDSGRLESSPTSN